MPQSVTVYGTSFAPQLPSGRQKCIPGRDAFDVEVHESDVNTFRRQRDELVATDGVAWVETREIGRRERTVLSGRRRTAAICELTF